MIQYVLAWLSESENDEAPYKRSVHRSFVGLLIDLAEVDSIGGDSKSLGVYWHKRAHEFARVHGSQRVTVHVFA